MTHPIPRPGLYREIATDYPVEVLGCTGSEANDLVYVRLPARDPHRKYDTLLGTFWDKYEEAN
jgi:hypothetical protein